MSKVKNKDAVVNCGKPVMSLVVCGDEVLLEQRPANEKGFPNEVIIPGGKNLEGETHLEAVKREIEEETGIANGCPNSFGK